MNMKIATIGRPELRTLSARVLELLAPLKDEFGIAVSLGAGTYGGTTGSVKIQMATINQDGQAETQEAQMFKLVAPSLGLKPEDLGRKFRTFGTKTFTLTGYNGKAVNYPLQAVDQNGKRFKFPIQQVVSALKSSQI